MRQLKKLFIFFIILGFMRVAFGVYEETGKFVPSLLDLQNAFATMPNIPQLFAEDFKEVENAFNTFTNGFTQITNISTFFIAMGNIFSLAWTAIELVIDSILIPVRFILWALGDLFGFF